MSKSERLVQKLSKSIANKGITKKSVCERAGISEATLNRLFSSRVKPTLETFIKLAEASGHELIIRVKQEEL
jgi:transcriptional regulator with XRE-family HTH domain